MTLEPSILSLRDACPEDALIVFKWRNDPWIISKGSLRKTVSWEEHSNWFSSIIADPQRHMFIIEVEGEPAGQARFIRAGRAAEISIYVLKDYIGKSFGKTAIQKSCRLIFRSWDIERIDAYVLEDNLTSHQTFEKCGFTENRICDRDKKDNHKLYSLKR